MRPQRTPGAIRLTVDMALDRGAFINACGFVRSPCDTGWILVYPTHTGTEVIDCYQFELNVLSLRRVD